MNEQQLFHLDPRLIERAEKALASCQNIFEKIDTVRAQNQLKVLAAFRDQGVGTAHLVGSTGYGYDDAGRDALDRVFAQIFGAEADLVRANFMSGTHTISTALTALLRPGDCMVSLTGTPYDTLHAVIGLHRKKGDGSLLDLGVRYREIPLGADALPDLDAIRTACRENIQMAYIQRSRGYSLRPSLTQEQTRAVIEAVRSVNEQVPIVVDNCYCEFVETKEPTDYGADLAIGSLIKNAGGGIARTGGYIVGRQDLVERCADRLCYVGVGREIGCTLDMNRELFLGLFMAPQTVSNAVKTAVFAARLFTDLGFEVTPSADQTRADIVQCLLLKNRERLCAFCRGIQSASPVDAHVLPEPAPMPGYESDVIMAAGTFTLGASIELSADAPLRDPYAVFVQGALTFDAGRIGLLSAAQSLLDAGMLTLE